MQSILNQLVRLSHRDLKQLGLRVAEEIRRRQQARRREASRAEAAPPAPPAVEPRTAAPLRTKVWSLSCKGKPRRAA
jgi:hypothetical protein